MASVERSYESRPKVGWNTVGQFVDELKKTQHFAEFTKIVAKWKNGKILRDDMINEACKLFEDYHDISEYIEWFFKYQYPES